VSQRTAHRWNAATGVDGWRGPYHLVNMTKPKFMDQILGPTFRYPLGKSRPDDEGELHIGIIRNPKTGCVEVHFGTSLTWIGMPPDQAIAFAEAIIKRAKEP
jgi:hypothetical protein